MKMEMVLYVDLKASAHLLSGSMLSYITCLSLRLSISPRNRIDMSAFKVVIYRT